MTAHVRIFRISDNTDDFFAKTDVGRAECYDSTERIRILEKSPRDRLIDQNARRCRILVVRVKVASSEKPGVRRDVILGIDCKC